MKRIIFTIFCVVAGYLNSNAQIMQASIGAGTTSARVKIYIRPITAVNGNIATFQFNIAIPTTVTPTPTLSFVGTPAFGSGWVIQPSYVEGGFRQYEIISSAGGNLVLGANTELEVMELEFSVTIPAQSQVSLYTLGFGGASGNALFFVSGAANSNSVAGANGLYYNRGNVTVVNNDSYNTATPSSATISGVLPISWLSFDAVKQGNDALLNWNVSNEVTNEHYELQRSLNGTDFVTISRINKTGSGNGDKTYTYTDAGVNALGSAILYYRIKQIDIDGRSSVSETRIVRLKGTGEISIFPNPVKDGFYVSVPLVNTDKGIIKMNLSTLSGQLVKSKEITALQASNYYFDIKDMNLAAGQYNLQITLEGKVLGSKKLIVNQ